CTTMAWIQVQFDYW
nr:immunoglobulin heavy chain junction region [Macaca mulatta]